VTEQQGQPRVPQVDLLRSPGRRVGVRIPRRLAEALLVVLAVLTWGTALIGLALLVGWRPHLAIG
jgi:hypothetical protein